MEILSLFLCCLFPIPGKSVPKQIEMCRLGTVPNRHISIQINLSPIDRKLLLTYSAASSAISTMLVKDFCRSSAEVSCLVTMLSLTVKTARARTPYLAASV